MLDDNEPVSYQDAPVGYEQRLRGKLEPANLRATMAFAGLYQITSEMIRHTVIDKVRDFYWIDLELDGAMSAKNKERYRVEVLSLARNKEFPASLKWLVQSKAITEAQADRLGAVHAHRNELTHELVRYMVDADAHPDIGLLAESLAILKDLNRFGSTSNSAPGGSSFPTGPSSTKLIPKRSCRPHWCCSSNALKPTSTGSRPQIPKRHRPLTRSPSGAPTVLSNRTAAAYRWWR